jgi:hypothetical protein
MAEGGRRGYGGEQGMTHAEATVMPPEKEDASTQNEDSFERGEHKHIRRSTEEDGQSGLTMADVDSLRRKNVDRNLIPSKGKSRVKAHNDDTIRIKRLLYSVLAFIMLAGVIGLDYSILVLYILPDNNPLASYLANQRAAKLFVDHFLAAIGVPFIAAASFCVVWILRTTEGQIEFEGWGLKFKGASGPVILWIFVFLAITFAVKLLW